MNRFMVRSAVGICATLALHLASWGAAAGPQIKTSSGVVEGKDVGTVRAFLGIAYAAPPVGDLRWKPPVPAAKWSGVRPSGDRSRAMAGFSCAKAFAVARSPL